MKLLNTKSQFDEKRVRKEGPHVLTQQMEAQHWIQKLVQVQLPELPPSNLDSIESSPELKDFLISMNNMLLVICYDVKVSASTS